MSATSTISIEDITSLFNQYIGVIEKIKENSIQNHELLNWCSLRIDEVINSFDNYSSNRESFNLIDIEKAFNTISKIKVEDLDVNLSLVENIVKSLEGQNSSELDDKHVKKTFEIVKDFYLYYLCYRKIDKYNCDDLYIVLNKCIVLDHISWDLPLLKDLIINKLNPLIVLSNCEDFSIWKNCALLNFKIHNYSKAIVFFEKSENLIPKNESYRYELIDIKIQKGYCHEYSHQFENAIKIFSELEKELEKNDKELSNDKEIEKLEINRDKLHEVYHALGHCYNEKAIQKQDEIDPSNELKKARMYLRRAVSENKYSKYKSCLGTIRSEYNEQIKAIKIYEEAENEIKDNNEIVKNELLFYKGYSYYCLDDFDNAEINYNKFEEYCESTYQKDGLAHTTIFKIKLELRKRDLSSITQSQIRLWVDELAERQPSVYVNSTIHDEWKQILNFLKALYHIQSVVSSEVSLVDSFGTIIYYLKLCNLKGYSIHKYAKSSNVKSFDLNNITIYLITDKKNRADFFKEIKDNTELNCTNIKSLNIDAGDLYKNPSERDINNIIVYIEDVKNNKDIETHIKHISEQERINYIVYDKNVDYLESINKSGVFNVKGRTSSIITFSNITDAVKASYILNVLEKIRLDLIASKFFFVLTPLRESSVYDYQTGQICQLCRNTQKKQPGQIIRFANQIKNLDAWYSERQRIYSENNSELSQYFEILIESIPEKLKQKLKLSVFFPLETSKKNYRISVKKKNSDIECVKSLLNERSIEKALKNIINSLYEKDGEDFFCVTNSCDGTKGHCCSRHFHFDFKNLKSGKVSDSFELLINNIPDSLIDQESHSLVWLKYFNQESIYENFKAGLLILIFDPILDAKILYDFCENQHIILEESLELFEENTVNVRSVNPKIDNSIESNGEVDTRTIETFNRRLSTVKEFIVISEDNDFLKETHEKAVRFYTEIKNKEERTTTIDEKEYSTMIKEISQFIQSNGINKLLDDYR